MTKSESAQLSISSNSADTVSDNGTTANSNKPSSNDAILFSKALDAAKKTNSSYQSFFGKEQSKEKEYKTAETIFIGGAGDNGAYKQDTVRALQDAGISNVRTTKEPASTGSLLMDAPAVVMFNNPASKKGGSGMYLNMESLKKQSNDPKEQYNLIGYSWGATIASQQAISATEIDKKTVDNLVLIGAPINQSMKDRLENNPNIKNIHYINLDKQGDPIYPGMSDVEIVASTGTLMYQMIMGTGHFYYSQSGPEGTKRRDELAKELKDKGLE